jgi:hypothetical protein
MLFAVLLALGAVADLSPTIADSAAPSTSHRFMQRFLNLGMHTWHVVGNRITHIFLEGRNTTDLTGCSWTPPGEARNLTATQVVTCNGTSERSSPRGTDFSHASDISDRPEPIALCVPPLYGAPAVVHTAVRHAAYHQSLGVSWTFLYSTFETHDFAENTTLLHVAWVHQVRTHQRGQLFQINDCLHRAASLGFKWTLNLDTDEHVVLLRQHQHSLHDLIGVGTDGRRGERWDVIRIRPRPCQGTPPLTSREVNGTSSWFYGCGRRTTRYKYLSRTTTVTATNIHGTSLSCDERRCRVLDLVEGHVFLAHLGQSDLKFPVGSPNRYIGMPGMMAEPHTAEPYGRHAYSAGGITRTV